MRRYLVAGLLVWIPLGITLWVLKLIVDVMDQSLLFLPASWQTEAIFGRHIPGLGIFLTLAIVLVTGMLAANFFGRKLLLLGHAFDTLGCKVVGLRTDNFNFRSQRAIEALGAKRDGIIRHHMPRKDGTVRDTYIYSILLDEWPDVKRHLEMRLTRRR